MVKVPVFYIVFGFFIVSLLNGSSSSTPAKILTTYNNEESSSVHGTETTRTVSGLRESTMVASRVDKLRGESVYEYHTDPMSALQSLLRLKRTSEGAPPSALELAKSAPGQKREEGTAKASLPLLPKAESTSEAAGGSFPSIPGFSGVADKIPGGGGNPGGTMYVGGFTMYSMPLSASSFASMAQAGQQLMPGMSSLPSMPTG